MSRPTFALVGPGRVGLAVTKRLLDAGYPLHAVVGASEDGLQVARDFLAVDGPMTIDLDAVRGAEILLIAVPDNQIASVAHRLHQQQSLLPHGLLLHFSGLYPASVMQPPSSDAYPCLSLHPLMTFPSAEAGYTALKDAPIAVEGTPSVLALGDRLAKELGGIPFRIASSQKALYHAAAVMGCNYAVALAAVSRDLLAQCGVSQEQAWQLLLPLMERTWHNLGQMSPEEALTGPIARGDVTTVAHHLEALPEALRPLYQALGRVTLDLVPEASDTMKELLDGKEKSDLKGD